MPSESGVQSGVDDKALPKAGTVGSILLTAVRCVAGWFVGYLVSAVSSILLFTLAHIPPEQPASIPVMCGVAVYGIVFSMIGVFLGASFSRRHALGIGVSITVTTWAMAWWSWHETPGHSHWTQLVAIVLMAPAALFAGFLRQTAD
jgi:hypothetical protein